MGNPEKNGLPPSYAPPSGAPPPTGSGSSSTRPRHTNQVILAGDRRAIGEQQYQQLLQSAQYEMGIYNPEIEPEHETEYACRCGACRLRYAKWDRQPIQQEWSRAVKYPGEKTYNDLTGTRYGGGGGTLFSRNPYLTSVTSPYGPRFMRVSSLYYIARPTPEYHIQNIHQTINLNNQLNKEGQAAVDAAEPRVCIWELDENPVPEMGELSLGGKGEKGRDEKRSSTSQFAPPPGPPPSSSSSSSSRPLQPPQPSKKPGLFSKIFKSEPVEVKEARTSKDLRDSILWEESGRWTDDATREIVRVYQEKVGMKRKIEDLRKRQPIQYLHLLRAGYFEPIPTDWSVGNSNPLKFSIEAAGGWRGITPAWRGFEDTAEERLYWVLNHREGIAGIRMKPDFISEMNMARDRMARAVDPPPEYFDNQDQCHVQHITEGYSKQVMPNRFMAYDRPEVATDDTMVLLDVSGSMDFDPLRPNYNKYLITGYSKSSQPKNKDVAKAIVRRFSDAMAHHDHLRSGYDLVTFSSSASYIGKLKHNTFDQTWEKVKVGGGTRVMTGWQKCKELHFGKHRESATWHPVFGWQAGPETPMLRLLLLLDGEATDMDEFELDLLGLSWAHVTIFLIGVDGCPHHHRHANELQRISDVNHHVSFVDAQGNTPERFVTHELLKRHLGMDLSLAEFTELEQLPAYEGYEL